MGYIIRDLLDRRRELSFIFDIEHDRSGFGLMQNVGRQGLDSDGIAELLRRTGKTLLVIQTDNLEFRHFHPLVNTATTSIRPADLVRFIEACGRTPLICDLGP